MLPVNLTLAFLMFLLIQSLSSLIFFFTAFREVQLKDFFLFLKAALLAYY